MMSDEQSIKHEKLSKKEIISYGLVSPAVNIGALICGSFLSMYFTDIAGIPVAAVGMIFLVARIFDGISDIIMGILIDKTHSKIGKAKPWILIGGLFSGAACALLFNVPKIGTTGMIIYGTVLYFLFTGIFNTMTGVGASTSVALITNNSNERTALGASFQTVQSVVSLIISVCALPLVTVFGGGQKGWSIFIILAGLVGYVFLYIFMKNTKERYAVEAKKEEKIGLGKVLKALISNKYFICITLVGLMLNLQLALVGSTGVYYANQILKNPIIFSLMSVAMYAPKFFGIPLCVPLMAKFGKRNVTIAALALVAAGMCMILVAPYSVTVVFAALLIKGIGTAPLLASFSAYTSEAADYGRYKTKLPMQSIYFSGTSFGNKVGAGLGGAVLGGILAWAGYDGLAEVQTATALAAIKYIYVFGAVIPCIIIILLLLPFGRLEKMRPEIEETLREMDNR